MDHVRNGHGALRGLILDYGEVLCTRPAPQQLEQMAEMIGIDVETLASRYYHDRGPYDRGDLDGVEYWRKMLSNGTAPDANRIEALRRLDVEMWSNIDPVMTQWLDDVRAAGLKTAMLSNMHYDMARHVRTRFDWLHRLDYVVLSCEIHVIKPDHAIYERCIEGMGLRAEEVCFVDDRPVNVQGAREVGLQALTFRSLDELCSDLQRIGFPVLPRAARSTPAGGR